MPVTFRSGHDDNVPVPRRYTYAAVIEQVFAEYETAIGRSADVWFVTMHEAAESTMITFDLARGTEAPRSLELSLTDDDASHRVLYLAMHAVLRAYASAS